MLRTFSPRVIFGKKQRVLLNADEKMIKDIKSYTFVQVSKLACGVYVVGRLVHEERAKVTGKQFMIYGRDQESGMNLVSNALRGPGNYHNADSYRKSGVETFNTKFERNVTISYSYLDDGTPPTPGEPSPTTPGGRSPTTHGEPSPTSPGEPSPTTPGEPSPTTPGEPSPTTPSTTTPSEPSPTTPGETSPTTPGEPTPTTLGNPSPTTPGQPFPTTPGEPSPTTPGEPSPTTPGEPSTTTPDEPSPSTTAVKADYAVIYCIPITEPCTNENNENLEVLQTKFNEDVDEITVAFTYSDRLLGTTDDYIKTLPEQFHTFLRKYGNNYIFISSSVEASKKNESNVDSLIKRSPSQYFGMKLGFANILFMSQTARTFAKMFI